MAVLELDRSSIAQRSRKDLIDRMRGRSREISNSLKYRIDAHADHLLDKFLPSRDASLVNHNVYFRLPQHTEIVIVKQEDPDAIYRNIFYTNKKGVQYAYRSEERDGVWKTNITSSNGKQREVFQSEGKALLRIMRRIEKGRERKDKAQKVIDVFKRTAIRERSSERTLTA